ncbi:MAG: hypothetical protein KatS3mg015_2131 [Fimbriimonadales bacterium]|nr:MAG: hypothetical protein KatS3mg015_2131 [Fimbriimonadales bacterium]
MVLACLTLAFPAFLQVPDSPNLPVRFKVEERSEGAQIRIKLVTPEFSSRSELARLANREAAQMVRSYLPEFLQQAKETVGVVPKDLSLFVEVTPVVSVAKENLISFYTMTFAYTGGAHPNRWYECRTFGLRNGRAARLKLQDFLPAGADPMEVANRLVIPRLKAMKASWFVEGTRTSLEPEEVENFVVTPAGITWIFDPYAAGPYVEGEFFVKVPWSEIRSAG